MSVKNFIQTIWSKKIQDDLELKLKLIFHCYDDIPPENNCECPCGDNKIETKELSDEDYKNPEVMAIHFWNYYKNNPFKPT